MLLTYEIISNNFQRKSNKMGCINPWSRLLLVKLIVTREYPLPSSEILPLVPILSKMNLVRNFPHYLPQFQSNIIFPFTLRSSESSLPFMFSDQNFVCISHVSQACHMPANLILLDLIYLIIFGEAYKL
jgi:hypothetical protein